MLPTQHGISDAVITAAMRASTFCLAPRGWTPTTTRLFDAVYEGCVPVVVGGLGNATGLWGLDWPFGAMLPGLRNAAIVVGEEQIAMLDEILLAVPEEEIVRRQLVLCELGRWAFAYRRALGERGGYAVGCREANATQGCGFGRDKGYLDVPGEEGRDAFDMFLMELAGRADQLGLVG
ncbi:exostosin family-domain-containing protein [Hyaloraphidium curvatum]|nr:exostosin family-domain-containing protein [Hyaloraphidium curvatum]